VTRGLRLRVGRAGSVMLTTVDDVTVLLGAPPGLIGRIASLPQVLSAIRRRGLGVRYVDLRFAGSVILKQGAPPSRGGVRHGAWNPATRYGGKPLHRPLDIAGPRSGD